MWHIIPPGQGERWAGGGPKPWVSSGSGLEERKIASSRSWLESLTLPRLNKDSDAMHNFPQMAKKKKFVWFQKELCRIHVLLTLESHSADGLCTLEPARGQGCVQDCCEITIQLSFCSCCVFLAPVPHLLADGLCENLCRSGWERDTAGRGVWCGGWENRVPGPAQAARGHIIT